MSPPILVGVGVVVVLIIALAAFGKKPAGAKSAPIKIPREVEQYVRTGNYGRAAAAASQVGRFDLALDYYLRAQQPDNAANMAIRLGNVRQGAELYERAGILAKAITYYERAGMVEKVKELKARVAPTAEEATASADAGSKALVAAFRKLADRGDQSEAARSEMQAAARRAADALLAEGNMSLAADVYADAELFEEAVHLYVNILGKPGRAAPILAQLGHHERAAELYEVAGEQERAAATWTNIARQAKNPEIFIDRIERLSRQQAQDFLEEETKRRPLSSETVELFYRLAQLLSGGSEADRAIALFDDIEAQLPGYKDVAQCRTILRQGGHLSQGAPSHTPAASTGLPDAATLINPEQLQALADQVAHAAAEQLRRQNSLDLSSIAVTNNAGHVKTIVKEGVGLEFSKIELDLAFDSAVNGARQGASVDSLMKFTGDRGCDLGNIEVYYRLGLAYMASGNWAAAAKAFEDVEETSAGYRDAWKRAEEIRAWEQAIGDKRTKLGSTPDGSGRYQLRGELGRGGMAIVYRGYDTVLDREVALKFLSSDMSAVPEVRDMFQREGRAVAQLNHPNIVTIHDVGVLDNRAFLCMEFVAGRSVESLASDPNGLTIVEGLQIANQVLTALAYAHSRRIIHRDIKPANFMRTPEGLVKLMDFGLAKSIDSGRQQSMIAGTPQYMAPEQLRGELVDHRTDLFAVAVSLYELFTGHLPFEGMERYSPPKPPSEYVPALPDVVNDAIMKGLEFSPDKRWQGADEMREPLGQVLTAVGSITRGTERQAAGSNAAIAAAATEMLA